MEGNRDEAEKCFELAENFLRGGNRAKGIKFLEKSIRLYPLKKAEVLLQSLHKNGSGAAGSHRNRSESQRDNKQKQGTSTNAEDIAARNDYSKEQVEACTRINNCKDYYEVLGISKEFTEQELKKNYRKLALQFHPDKNHAPGATDAFKKIGNAFAVLNDPVKRKKYDHYGEQLGPTHSHYSHYEDEYEADISPEEIFNIFFGGGYPTGRVYVRRGRNAQMHRHHYAADDTVNPNLSSYYPLIQLLPIMLLILFSLLSSLMITEAPYSFERTSTYKFPRVTKRFSVQYFVQDGFETTYSGQTLQALERKIEKEYREKLQINCYRERQYKHQMLYQSRMWGSPEMQDKAESLGTPSCDLLYQYHNTG